jgi:hypothetical protein
MLMFVVLSAEMLTGLTATGMSLGQIAFAEINQTYVLNIIACLT